MNQTAIILLVILALLVAAAFIFAITAWARRGPQDDLRVSLLRLFNELYLRVYHRLQWSSESPGDPLPSHGPAIVVANHRSGVDPLALTACTKRAIRFLMAREFYALPGLHWIFQIVGAIPVNRDGNDLGATKAALKVLREGGIIGIFPQGGIRLESNGRNESIEIKAGAALLALRSGAPIIPALIRGTPSLDSVFRAILTPSRASILFGKPLQLEVCGKKPTRQEIEDATNRIQERLNELRVSSPGF